MLLLAYWKIQFPARYYTKHMHFCPLKKRNRINTFQKCIVSIVAMLEGHVVFLFQVMTVQGQEEESIGP